MAEKTNTNFGSDINTPTSHSTKLETPTISVPSGGGSIKGVESSFHVNSMNGTANISFPFPLSSSRNGTPDLGLNYSSSNGNGPFGLGWNINFSTIERKTSAKIPRYRDNEYSDTFVLDGMDDLVPAMIEDGDDWVFEKNERLWQGTTYTVQLFRPRIESGFARVEFWKEQGAINSFWRVLSADNIHSYYGLTENSRLSDPEDPSKVFKWMLCRTHNDKGSIANYEYKKEDHTDIPNASNEKNRGNLTTQAYLKKVFYGNRNAYYLGDALPTDDEFLFQLILDYGEHPDDSNPPLNVNEQMSNWDLRKDPFSSFRAGFEIRTYRRCKRALVFHCFDEEDLSHSPYLVKSLNMTYNDEVLVDEAVNLESGLSFLQQLEQIGYKWNSDTNSYDTKSLPESRFSYQPHAWSNTVQEVEPEQNVHAPNGIDNLQYLWIDFMSEGIAGILTEQNDGWFYKSNLGNGNFSNALEVAPKPSFSGLSRGRLSIGEVEANGVKNIIQYSWGNETSGFYSVNKEGGFETFKPFENVLNANLQDENARLIDLDGNGIADLLQSDQDSFMWYPNLGQKGFDLPEIIQKELDEEQGPALLFSDKNQQVFLADMNGDGLTDILSIQNGEIAYWPNMGYGKFGSKTTMDNSPILDYPDSFNPELIRLADIDGSGTTDLIYLGQNEFKCWTNNSGNEWSEEPISIFSFPKINSLSNVQVLDFLGTGTACIVYSSGIENAPIQYIDLMESIKPNLLNVFENNCGSELKITYKTSTQYFLEDKLEGIDWITKLPFPIHLIEKMEQYDHVQDTLFTNSYSYRHGYFDPIEREFRGFARVEQIDSEDFSSFSLNETLNVVEEGLHQSPVRVVTWYHTGAFIDNRDILHQCQDEYFQNTHFSEYDLPNNVLPENLTTAESIEAYRACKSVTLRSEIFADDDSVDTDIPFSAVQSTIEIRMLQPGVNGFHPVFQIIPSERINYHYERNPADPRISHSHTLETDSLGNITKSAIVNYARATRPMGADAIPDEVWDEQKKNHVSYTEQYFTNDIDKDDVYCIRVGYETKMFVLNGISIPAGTFIDKETLNTEIAEATTINYETDFSNASVEKRLSKHTRVQFLKDDFSGPLTLGIQEDLGFIYKQYSLAFTKGLVTKHYGVKVTDAMLTDAKYVHSEGDEHWWTQTGMPIYSASPANDFYIPIGTVDVYGNQNTHVFDTYKLLVNETVDSLGNTITSINDYRTLCPVEITDPNMNRTAVEMDELGFVVKVAVMGKEGDGDGDTLENPTKRTEYNFTNWRDNGQPNYVHRFHREEHDPLSTKWQESRIYNNGSGRMIMTKGLVEPGIAKEWNPSTKVVDEINSDPRWVANGRTVFNNKGNIIKQFDPYFSTNVDYESESALVETGMSQVVYYDALGRKKKIEFPGGTLAKSEFDVWKFQYFDQNDTVGESEWYVDRGSPDPLAIPEPVDPEIRAAWLTAKHDETPMVSHTDSMGNPFYSVQDYGGGKTVSVYTLVEPTGRSKTSFDQLGREVAVGYSNLLGVSMYSENAEKGERWGFADVIGRMVRVWDNAIREIWTTFDELHRPVSAHVKEGASTYQVSHIVYGESVPDAALKNLNGNSYRIYDQSGVITFSEIDFKGNTLEVERQLCLDYKSIVDWSVFAGITDVALIEAAAVPLLDTEVFTSSTEVDAMNRPLDTVLPDDTVIRSTYNQSNFLSKVEVQVRGSGSFVPYLKEQDYDARGQRQFATLGNNLITNYFYDAKTFRLVNLITKQDGANDSTAIQNLHYTYDPTGNVVYSRDDAQQTHFFQNAVVAPEQSFEYDAIYQLVKAAGREHAGIGANVQKSNIDTHYLTQLPHLNNATAVRNFSEEFEYDDCGNIQSMKHVATGNNWTRYYNYHYEDDPTNLTNRLKSTSSSGDPVGGPYSNTYLHDSRGNMISMPHLATMEWDFMDHLKKVDLGGGGASYYTYGANGNRSRKIVERSDGRVLERIYLGPLEIYREHKNDKKRFERTTIHVSDGKSRIAQIDTKLLDLDNVDSNNILNHDVIRYQYHNNLGSAALETNENGDVISYEEYHPFGSSSYRSSKSGTDISLKRYRFSGKERDDETGLYYFGARYYAAWLGRWTSTDPGGFVDGFNQYRYCRNNPVNLKDPHGTDPKWTTETRRIVPNTVTNETEFAAWAKRVGLEYEGTPVHGPNGWTVDRYRYGDPGTGGPSGTPGGTGGTAPPDASTTPPPPPDTPPGGDSSGGDPGGTRTTGPPGGTPGGDPNATAPGGRTTGPPGGTPGGTSSDPDDDGFSFDSGNFFTGLLGGIAVGFLIAAAIIAAPITIPASVAIGAAVVGGGLLVANTVQSARRRDMLNRPISNEQANFNMGFGFGGAIGGAAAGPMISGGSGLARGMGQGMSQFGGEFGGMTPALVGANGGGGGAAVAEGIGIISIPATVGQSAVGVSQGVTTMMSMSTGGNSNGNDGDNPSDREFFDPDDAAEAVPELGGRGSRVHGEGVDIGPVKNEGVRRALERMGYDPNDFRAIQYEASGPRGNMLITIFESEGGVYFGPHWSSGNL